MPVANLTRRLRGLGFQVRLVRVDTFGSANIALLVSPEALVEDSRRLTRALAWWGVNLHCHQVGGPAVEAVYDPVNDVAVIDIIGVDDSMLLARPLARAFGPVASDAETKRVVG